MKDQATPNGQQAPQDEQTEIRDRRRRSWIWVESALIDLYGARIGPYGIAAYVTLSRFANNETQTAFPSLRKLAKLAGMTVLTLRKTLQDLARLNLIRITPRVSAKGDRDTNIYTLIEVPLDPPPVHDDDPDPPPEPKPTEAPEGTENQAESPAGGVSPDDTPVSPDNTRVCQGMTHGVSPDNTRVCHQVTDPPRKKEKKVVSLSDVTKPARSGTRSTSTMPSLTRLKRTSSEDCAHAQKGKKDEDLPPPLSLSQMVEVERKLLRRVKEHAQAA